MVDEFTHECLAIRVARKLKAADVIDVLPDLLADPDQAVRVEVACAGACPASLHDVVLRVAQELVGNAVKHGFYARLAGRIRLDLVSSPRETRLVAADDGWGLCRKPGDGQGLCLVRALIAPFGGTLALRAGNGVTAEVILRPAAPGGRVAALVGRAGLDAA